MSDPQQDSPAALCGEILREAGDKAAEIVRQAKDEAAAVIARGQAADAAAREEALSRARAEAARETERLMATIPVELGRMLREREARLLDGLFEEIDGQLAGATGRDNLIALGAQGIAAMEGSDFVLLVSGADRAALDADAPAEIAARAGRPALRIEVAVSPEVRSGVMIRDAAGRQWWDNRLSVRLARMWPELRRRIALEAGLLEGTQP